MNRARLLDRLSETSDAVERLREELNQIDGDRDDFAAFLFQARREFRRSVDRSTKSGRAIKETIRDTFKVAVEMGYKGPFDGWKHLLDIPTKRRQIPRQDLPQG